MPAQLAKLGHIRAAGEHLLSLINDVLDLSSLESGELRLALQPVDLGAAGAPDGAAGANRWRRSTASRSRSADARGAARADATRLRQVLLNLLTNAIKYNRRGGRCVVETRARGGRGVLRVRDTGRGMNAEQLASLFEPFNRLGVESEGIEGTGIGLTIVKALVEGMGGSVAVSSKPGEGSCSRCAAAPRPTAAGAGRPRPPTRRRRPGASRAASAPAAALHRGQPGQRAAGRGAGEDRRPAWRSRRSRTARAGVARAKALRPTWC